MQVVEKIRVAIDDFNEVPFVKINGKEIKNVISINFIWETSDDKNFGRSIFEISYFDGNVIKTLKNDRYGPPMKGGDNDNE